MNKQDFRPLFRGLIWITIMFTVFYIKDTFRSIDNAPQQKTDFAALIAEEIGEDDIVIYSNRKLENVSGFDSNYKVIYLVKKDNLYTDMGCAFFSEKEINKKVGFFNVVSGYDVVLDKVCPAEVWVQGNGTIKICIFDSLTYDGWTFAKSLFVITNDNTKSVELKLQSGETKPYNESHIETVYEITQQDEIDLDTINFYNDMGYILSEFNWSKIPSNN